jgi:hypothetical protein
MSKEERPFEGILGNTVQLRLLENLIANGPANFNKRELGEVAGIARASTDKAIESFLEWGILKVSEKHGAMTLYALDFDSALVRSMIMFNESIIRRLYPSMLEAIYAEDAK